MTPFVPPKLSPGGVADVALLLEGTYPFVSGGVSSWVHQLVRGLPELTFAVVFLGGARERYGEPRYTLPRNVVHLETHFLSDALRFDRVVSRRGDREFAQRSARLHDALSGDSPAALAPLFESVVAKLLEDPERHERDFLFGERAWDAICAGYERSAPGRSFLEYFWTVRSTHAPLFQLARVAALAPRARAFHAVSTGFAGLLGALLRRARARPLVLTEHGIYTKERRIELLQAEWIRDDADVSPDAEDASVGCFRAMWIRFFEALGKMTYDAADPILSLYEGNRARQVRDGADPARTRVVPNGVAVARFAPLRERRPLAVPPVLGLIGRVVPIKDIKTFIRAIRVVCDELPEAEGWIAGPEDEDPAYADECRQLAAGLGLLGERPRLRFLGFQRVEEVLPRLGLNVLTSISEAQPLTLLEGFAAGVPCVASDVGCCRELVLGAGDEDRALGAAGAVVDIADPEATARAAIALLRDQGRWRAAQRAGIARVERYYGEPLMMDRYRAIHRAAVEA
jgi:glycosyltransferase involved in cell wall biosynthesis